ncbi:MAG: hypothetical protein Q8Q49_03210 [bacterium]|nr:hypothetical protein [bacterium]
MQVTTQAIIKAFPFDEEFKLQLLEKLDTLDPLRKYQVTKILWDTYYSAFDAVLAENLDQEFDDVGNGNAKLDKDFFKRAADKTEQEMLEEIRQATEQVDLSGTRHQLEEIMQRKDGV